MGIDIYLNGYDAYQERIKDERAAFESAVAKRNAIKLNPETNESKEEYERRQAAIMEASERMWTGGKGYLRSSYNSAGLFRVLEEIFGFDVAAYLFPGDWNVQPGVPIDADEFMQKVHALAATAVTALRSMRVDLPWTDIFTEITQQRAPDNSEQHVQAEAFGDSVMGLVRGVAAFDNVEPKQREQSPRLCQEHAWYLTTGMQNIFDFAKLAKRLQDEGNNVFAYISF